MKVNYTNPNIIVSKSINPQFRAEAQKPVVKTAVPAQKINEDRYNAIGAAAGLTILAGIGIVLVHGAKLYDALTAFRRIHAEKAKEIKIIPLSRNNGPNFNIDNGKTAIADGWNKYIKEIETRIKSNKKGYTDIFEENAEQLDKYETLAKIKSIRKLGARYVA